MTLLSVVLRELVAAGLQGEKLIAAMERIESQIKGSYAARGQAGGKARAESLSPARRSAIAKTAAEKRWRS